MRPNTRTEERLSQQAKQERDQRLSAIESLHFGESAEEDGTGGDWKVPHIEGGLSKPKQGQGSSFIQAESCFKRIMKQAVTNTNRFNFVMNVLHKAEDTILDDVCDEAREKLEKDQKRSGKRSGMLSFPATEKRKQQKRLGAK